MKIRMSMAIVLGTLFLAAFAMRFYGLSENLFFGPEQGADLLRIKQIVNDGQITLIGAKTDVDGVFHGPLFLYVSAVPFFISGGDVLVISSFLIAIHCLAVFLIFVLGRDLFNQRVGLMAATIFTVSFGAIVFSRWLASPSLSLPLSVLFFLSLFKFLQGNLKYILPLGLSFGLLVQVEFLNLVMFGGIVISIAAVYRKDILKYKKLPLLLVILILVFFSSINFIIFDLRHDFLISKSLLQLVVGDKGYFMGWIDSIKQTIVFAYNSFYVAPFQREIGIIIVISIFFFFLKFNYRKNRYALLIPIWVLVPLIIIILLRHGAMEQWYAGILPGIILLMAVFVDKIFNKNYRAGVALLSLLLLINIVAWINNIPENKYIYFQAGQPNLKYKDQIAVIDEIYKRAGNEKFSFQAYTIPYWWQDAWQYLFWQYGEKKYGRLPAVEKAPLLFVIVQDDPSNSNFQKDWLVNVVNNWGKKESEFRQGVLRVEVRRIENM